jgi:glycerol-3-phosphate dehydrogenase
VVNHAEVNELLKDPQTGKITGVRIRDLLPTRKNEDFVVRTKVGS